MKARIASSDSHQSGFALVMTMILSALALAVLASVLAWTATSSRLTHRSIDYTRSVAAAEAATEKVISHISTDFLSGGERLVSNNISAYSGFVPTSSDSSYWNTWAFNNGAGNNGNTFVQRVPGNSFIVVGSTYAGLKGYASTYTIVSHATDQGSAQNVMGGVFQQIQLVGIPIFQFAMYSYSNMEVSCGEPFSVTGPVHSNGTLYVEPDSSLTFESSVEAVISILNQRDVTDGDNRGALGGSVVYEQNPQSPANPLTLPIGTANTPDAIRQIIEPPPPGEDPGSLLGQLRYYNECDMLITVSDSGTVITSGSFNNFSTVISNSETTVFINTTNSFADNREGKTVDPIDVDVGSLSTWIQTNNDLRFTAVGSNLTSVYVVDNRHLPASQLGAVRVRNGTQLPPNGLTVATGRPLYVLGDYNEQNPANLGTADTSATRPASLVGDAVTILSDSWQDSQSTADVSARNASATTVNAAILTGVVETSPGHYSGGMENFPRFLETWGSTVFTYNGSMIKMFPSLFATGVWGQDNVYVPPARNWAFDINFTDPTRLPPKTPSVLTIRRSRWATVPPGQNIASTSP